MKNLFFIVVITAIILLGTAMTAVAQRVANYTPTRATGITYNSISNIGNSVNSWRNSDPGQMLDDNRSNPIPIGFDFWYDGVRYTTLSVGINGLVDFSSSAATGYTPGDYDSDNFGGTNPQIRMTALSGNTSRNALAVLYGDLTTQNIVDPLGNSFKYLTTGTAPNRVLTVEWINLSYWNQYLGESYNFQLKLYENTGVIEFLYGNNTAGTGIPLKYKTGLNAPSFTALSDSVVMIQQNANSTYFLPQPVPAWPGYGGGYNDTLPTANSKLVFTPPTPADPTNLTFSAITQTSMTLNWKDNANNEIGYVIYNSLDGSNYTYITQLSRNSISYPAAGLSPGTTYYWRVYAVTEGRLSANLDGSQATTGATLYTSQGTGNWNAITWSPAGPPANYSDIQIRDVDVVTINQNIAVNSITVGTGTGGTLQIGNDATARTLNVLGNITVNAGAQFAVNTGSATSSHMLNLSGNILNNGTFDLGPSATSRCQATFNKSGNQTISGTCSTTRFYLMTLNMGTTNSNVLDVTTSNFSTQSTGFLTITNGTFKYEAPSAITPFTANTTVPLTGGLWVNNSSATVTTTSGNLSYTGFVRVTAGVLNVGTAADQQLLSNGGDIIIEGGAVNVAGSFNRTNNMTITRFTMTGGTLRVATVSSTSTTLAPFMMDIIGSSLNMSGGGIIVVREGGTGSNDLGYVNTGTTSYSVTGGTLQIGDYTTPAGQIMQVNTNIPVFNFIDSSANATMQLMTNNLTVNNNVLIAAGTLNANNLNINVQGNWTNQGTFIPGTGTVTFNGSTGSTITKVTGETFNNLTINKSSNDVSLGSAVTINGTLTFTAGNLNLGSNNLTLGGTVSGAGDGKCVVTNGTGVVSRVISAAGSFTFPVGITAYCDSVKITADAATTVNVSIKGAFTDPVPDTTYMVRVQWTTSQSGTANLTYAFTWKDIQAGSNFTPSSSAGWQDLSTVWANVMNGTTAGTTFTALNPTTIVGSFLVGNAGALPVEMTSFTAVAQKTSAQLKWSTATEVNNYGFEIERRAIASSAWAKVGFVSGAGTSNSKHNYTYADNNLSTGKYAYRLKQIDNDGAYKYSASTEVTITGVPKELKLYDNYPNPFNPTTKVQFTVPENGNVRLRVYNVIGQEVATLFNGVAEAGNLYTVNFDGSRMASGLYFSVLEYGNKRITHKMMMTK